MAIPVQCPYCVRRFQVDDSLGGKKVKCACGQAVEVPARTAMSDLLDSELNVETNPVICNDPGEWAEAVGADPEIAERLQKRLRPKASSNANFMMGIIGAIAALLLIIGLAAIMLRA
ncbi:MAG: hypothetical protein PVH19_05905 [Planctomycetia bacterium]